MPQFYPDLTSDSLNDHFKAADGKGTLLTEKHHPDSLTATWDSYRTVLSKELAPQLLTFLTSGHYTANLYQNIKFPNSPIYIEIVPDTDSGFAVSGSGVPKSSLFSDSTMDRLIAVSGSVEAWHVFAEDSSIIQRKVTAGDLVFVRTI